MQFTLRQRISREILPFVRHPAQYIGGEVNQLAQEGDWEKADLRVVVGFPDTYSIGMSHLGCQILYWLCNHTPGVCAERTYAPWIDAEKIMRARGIPLWTWDTRRPVKQADIFGVSLQYELCFTTVLNLLDLAGIPLHSDERDDSHPLVIAGGPQADNPEPMAEFMDLVVFGDGEHSLAEILKAYREYRAAGVRRRAMIPLLARRFPWIYAPSLYEARHHPNGAFSELVPRLPGLPTHFERCRTPDFDAAPFPRKPLVPWLPVVHDRIGIEIMRGCPQVCRFCHAGYTKRPLFYRSVDRILEIAEEAYRATGHDEISLLSLSTADYPLLPELALRMNERFSSRMVNLSFPSLRVDKMLAHIPAMGASVRRGGITMAVEAARDDMRRAIRKKVTDGNLLDGVRAVYRGGWKRLKLYFMAGFPGERAEDIDAIWDLCCQISLERSRMGLGPPGEVTASVGWLVPKPFTPLQWMAQPREEYFHRVREQLRRLAGRRIAASGSFGAAEEPWSEGSEARNHEGAGNAVLPPDSDDCRDGEPAATSATRTTLVFADPRPQRRGPRARVSIKTHDPRRSVLEAVFARGDRRLCRLVYEAWRRGARFDAWDEVYDDSRWQEAYAATGIDPAWYAHRERGYDEALPWEHVGLHMRRAFLEKSYDDMFTHIRGVRRLPVS